MSNIKAVIFGGGTTGQLCARYLAEKNVEIVGMFTRTSHLGKEIGDLIGMPGNVTAKVSCDPQTELAELNADIAVIATGGLLTTLLSHVKLCGAHGVDVICLNENAFYPWIDSKLINLAEQIDHLAKTCGITVFATGVQDVVWHALPLATFASLHRIDKIEITNICNLDDLGVPVLKQCRVGESIEDFDFESLSENPDEGEVESPPLDGAARGLLNSMGFQIVEHDYSVHPITADVDINSISLGQTIPKGRIIGVREVTKLMTREGIELVGEFISQVLGHNERLVSTLRVLGEPNIELTTPDFPGHEITCATLVNRIPDVLNAKPGFAHINRFPGPMYHATLRM